MNLVPPAMTYLAIFRPFRWWMVNGRNTMNIVPSEARFDQSTILLYLYNP
jgi:hypothetical protein